MFDNSIDQVRRRSGSSHDFGWCGLREAARDGNRFGAPSSLKSPIFELLNLFLMQGCTVCFRTCSVGYVRINSVVFFIFTDDYNESETGIR